MKKSELKTNDLKKLINAKRIAQRWHNKNKSGGNFGLNIYFGDEFVRGRDKEITGNYNSDGEITSLHFGNLYWGNQSVPKECFISLEELAKYLNKQMENQNG